MLNGLGYTTNFSVNISDIPVEILFTFTGSELIIHPLASVTVNI